MANVNIGQSLEFLGLQILNCIIHSTPSTPTAYASGQVWYKSDTYGFRIRGNAQWDPIVVGPQTSVNTYIPQWDGTLGDRLSGGLSLVTTVGATGVDTAVPTEQAVREAIAAAIASDVSFMGGYNASTNSPALDATPVAIAQGDMYFVTVAGTFFSTPLESGDVIIANINSAAVEADWTIIQRNLPSLIPVANGGTGLGTLTQYGIMIGAGTGNVQFVGADATANKHLKNVSATANPTWSSSSFAEATGAGKILRASGANVWAESTITIVDAFASGGIPHASAANTITNLAISATAGVFLRSTGTLPSWGAVVYPNAAAIGDLLYASTTTNIAMLTAVTAGSFLRSAGTGTAPAWSTVKLPDTMSALGIWVANSLNTVVNLTVAAGQSIRMNVGGTAWEAYTPGASTHTFAGATHSDVTLTSLAINDILKWNGSAWINVPIPASGGSHTLLGTSTHSDSTNTTVVRGMLMVGNSTPAWTGLAITASGVSGYVLATNATDVAWKKQRYVEKLTTSATSYNIVHNLGTRRVLVTVQDTTNNQNILVDWACTAAAENNSITINFGSAPAINTRIVTVFGINFENALDTAN